MSDFWDTKSGLTKFNGLNEMVVSYWRAREHLEAGFASIAAARVEFDTNFCMGNGNRSVMNVTAYRHSHHQISADPSHALERLKRDAWCVIVDRLELQRVMSNERWFELQKQLESEELPEITTDSVAEFARHHVNMRSLEQMMKESIVEVFEWLRPRGYYCDRYKSNTQLEIGPKVVLGMVVELDAWSTHFKVRYGNSYKDDRQMMLSLERVFHWLDGRGQVSESYQSELQQAIERSPRSSGRGETDLFKFRACQNRTLHLTFKRLDLLKRFNAIAGGARLRPTEAGESDLAVA